MKLIILLFPFILLFFRQVLKKVRNKKDLLSISSLLVIFFIHNFWVVVFTIVLAFAYYLYLKGKKWSVLGLISIVIVFLVLNKVDFYFPNLEFILFNGQTFYSPLNIGVVSLLLLRSLFLINKEGVTPSTFSDSLFKFSFIPTFYLPLLNLEENKMEALNLNLLLKYYCLAITFKGLFSETFFYWISYGHISSLNTIQALYLLASGLFHTLSELAFMYFIFQMILQCLNFKAIQLKEVLKNGIKLVNTNSILILSIFIISLAFINNLPLLLLCIIITWLVQNGYNKKRVFRICILLLIPMVLLNFSIHSLEDIKVILSGVINIQTIFVYYNELFILWPFKMSFITTLLLIVFPFYIWRVFERFDNIKPISLLVLYVLSVFLLEKNTAFSLL